MKLPLLDEPGAALLVWTTTPWTLAANVAAAVKPDLTYARVRQGDEVLYLAEALLPGALRGEYEVLDTVRGRRAGRPPLPGPFDELPAQQGVEHRVIAWDEVSDSEGTGIVHIAPGCGKRGLRARQAPTAWRARADRRERRLRRRLRLTSPGQIAKRRRPRP